MNKKLFLNCLDDFKKYSDWEDKLSDLGINLWEQDDLQKMITDYLQLLAYSCKDKFNNIDYYIYETDFGKKSDEFFITEQDGNIVKFYTAEDLWNYLVKENPDIEDKPNTNNNNKNKEYNYSKNKSLTIEELEEIFYENFTK